MNFYWEDATKRIQQELSDPRLRVEFNSETQLYEVMQWKPRVRHVELPGFLFGSNLELVPVGVETGYFATQMTFDTWDSRVFETMRRGRPERLSAKELEQDMEIKTEKIKESKRRDEKDREYHAIMGMHKALKPTIYSYQR